MPTTSPRRGERVRPLRIACLTPTVTFKPDPWARPRLTGFHSRRLRSDRAASPQHAAGPCCTRPNLATAPVSSLGRRVSHFAAPSEIIGLRSPDGAGKPNLRGQRGWEVPLEADMKVEQQEAAQTHRFWSRLSRPRLFAGLVSGIAVYVLLMLVESISGRLRFILAWDIGVLVALVAMLVGLRDASPERMQKIAARQVTGKWTVLALTVVAASASLVVIAAEVPLIKAAEHFEQVARLTLIVVTIVLSWLLINTIFALHYAHDYYLRPCADGAEGSVHGHGEGLIFPGSKPPAYGDFVYFSFTIGMTFQVSDVQITSSSLRQLAITHGIISFFYSTGILALTVNLVAGML